MTPDRQILRIPELDGLRGLAILAVMSFHYLNNQLVHAESQFARALYTVTSFGWVGVDLFFVLSGYLIGNILILNKNATNYFSVFYWRRFVRIIPTYYFALALFLFARAIPGVDENYFLSGNLVIPFWSYWLLLQNFFMADLANLGNSALSVTWSIAIEEQFYILFPLIVFFVNTRLLPVILAVVIILASIVRLQFDHWIPAYVLLPSRMDALAFGIFIAHLKNETDLKSLADKYYYWLLFLFATLMVALGGLYLYYGDLGPVKHSLFAVIFSILLIIALTKKSTWFAAFLRWPVLMWIGTISYSLYLLHYFILGVVHHMFGNTQGIGMYTPRDIGVSLVALGMSFLIAWVTYHKIEMPMVALGKRMKYKS